MPAAKSKQRGRLVKTVKQPDGTLVRVYVIRKQTARDKARAWAEKVPAKRSARSGKA